MNLQIKIQPKFMTPALTMAHNASLVTRQQVITTVSLPNHNSPFSHHNTLKSLIINCQSIHPKKEHFINLLSTNHPDLVFGCESCLTPIIHNAELFPPHYVYDSLI